MNPKYPVFVPSKGRHESRLTIKFMESYGIPFRVVVEPQEFDLYAAVVDPKKLLVTPHSNKGLVVTRNWIWDYACDHGFKRFWTFDDNIRGIWRIYRNLKIKCTTGTPLAAIEEFADRFANLPVCGMQYQMFVARKEVYPPLTLNTRVYSNMLIDTFATDHNSKPFRNEGFYNDDTDLCLRILKDGQCVCLFNSFLIWKMETMKVKGGMTEHYVGAGRWKMAKELQLKHPDVVKITYKFSKWQHSVDYRRFRGNKLILKPGVVIPQGINEFGMTIQGEVKQPRS